MDPEKARQTTEKIMAYYELRGGEAYAGEKVSQLEHMVQAAELAEAQGQESDVILSAFLHDIGHICEDGHGDNEMGEFGILDHEAIGGAFLAKNGFSPKVSLLVESHVEAKRYLTFRYPEYFARLSEASRKTLEFQGGRMDAEEAAAFEQQPLFSLIIQMRRWDEEAKVEHKPLPDLNRYKAMIYDHLLAQ
jgi:phosphonate degradation associated HDIG domain protein